MSRRVNEGEGEFAERTEEGELGSAMSHARVCRQ